MTPSSRIAYFVCLALLPVATTGASQRLSKPILAPRAALDPLVRKSGYIFSGTVLSVTRVAAPGSNQVPIIRTTFRVEQGLRGVRTGQVLTIHEWAGLWDAAERYRAGERLLLFLYPLSRAGLTSPVGGSTGRFQVDRSGQVAIDSARLSNLWHLPAGSASRAEEIRITTQDFARAVRQAEKE